MNQAGRLTARGYHGRLADALARYRRDRESLIALLGEAYDALDALREEEQNKLDNIELAGTGLEYTPKAENIRDAAEALENLVADLEQMKLHLEPEETDYADIDLSGLFEISKHKS